MAETKKDAPQEVNFFWTYLPFVLIVVVLILGSRMSGQTIFGQKLDNPSTDIVASKKNIFDIYEWFGKEGIVLSGKIINTKDVAVRTAPGGSILGTQKKLESARPLEGPVLQFNTTWWRLDYTDAPDGWVEIAGISPKIGLVRSVNIVPLVYGFYKPIGYVLLILLLILFIYFKLMLNKEEKIAEKKKELKLEAHQEVQKPISQLIEEKPNVQEVKGFKTEEIVPVKIAEQNNRWKHIQDLITSYNSNDWRQAIIEADILLEEMLNKMGYDGVSIGDKLKKVERSDFITLDRAWSAHKVRNQIAHDGSAFKMTRELAEKTIKEYEEVFREFYYI